MTAARRGTPRARIPGGEELVYAPRFKTDHHPWVDVADVRYSNREVEEITPEVPVKVEGRPYWSRDLPPAVQRLIVEHRLSKDQYGALLELRGVSSKIIGYSVARALRDRGLGEISSHVSRALTRHHPKADFVPGEAGRALVHAITQALVGDLAVTIEQVSTNLVKVTAPPPEASGSYRNVVMTRRGLPYRDDR